MKKVLVQLPDFDESGFTYKYDLGILLPRSVLNHPEQKVYIYNVDEKSEHKMSIGIGDDDTIIAKHNGQYYQVLEGVQSNMFLLLADAMPSFQKMSQKRLLDTTTDTVSD